MKLITSKKVVDLSKEVEIKKYLSISILGRNLKLDLKFKNIKYPETSIGSRDLKIALPKKYERLNKKEILNKVIEKIYYKIALEEVLSSMEVARTILGFAPEDYEIKEMKNEYIKVNSKKVIFVNPEIVKYSRRVIDSSIIEAFCKIRYKKDSKNYKENLRYAINAYDNLDYSSIREEEELYKIG